MVIPGLIRSTQLKRRERSLARLAQELLDAHIDTALLARDLGSDPSWRAHLDYLRDLQRVGHETLAMGSQPPDPRL
jgi:hypothetical protein